MKRYRPLLLAVCILFLNFICFWYMDVLFNRFFVLGLIPVGLAVILLILYSLVSLTSLIRGRERMMNGFSLLICAFAVCLIAAFPFRKAKVDVELKLLEKDRMQVLELIEENQLLPDALGNVQLPRKYRKTSSDGTVYVYRNDEEQVICFWVFRGMLSGSVQLVYSSRDESLIWNNETVHPIESMEQLKEHWYLVNTDY